MLSVMATPDQDAGVCREVGPCFFFIFFLKGIFSRCRGTLARAPGPKGHFWPGEMHREVDREVDREVVREVDREVVREVFVRGFSWGEILQKLHGQLHGQLHKQLPKELHKQERGWLWSELHRKLHSEFHVSSDTKTSPVLTWYLVFDGRCTCSSTSAPSSS